MSNTLSLLPQPQRVTIHTGGFTLPASGVIALAVERPADLLFTAQHAQQALSAATGHDWQIAGGTVPAALTIAHEAAIDRTQGYRLTVDSAGIRIAARDNAGAFYGVLTLAQLLQTHGAALPALTVDDWPDFPARGVMLDISRDKVPTMATLYALVDLLASWKINQVQLYTEHTFAYSNHRTVWEHASPLTAGEILALDAYCRERFIDLVPNQNSFGHMHRWFEHERYLPLAEVETEFESPWGTIAPPYSLSPAVPQSLDLLDELFAELLPNFTSQMFNVGCDETIDLGLGKSKAQVEQHGKGRVYLDFVLNIYERVTAHNRTMQFWGDIINQYPDLVPEIPKDTIALEWGYEADHDFAGKARLFADSGVPFYVCPGTSSWNTIAGRTENCIGNTRSAVENGLKHGAIGVLNTDWGDNGHWQTLPVSYLGFAYGAALSWAYAQNADIDLLAALDAFAFRDRAGIMGKIAYDLGNAYQIPGVLQHNSSLLFNTYHRRLADARQPERQTWLTPDARAVLADDDVLREKLEATLAYVDRVTADLPRAAMTAPDADLITCEFALAAQMLRHGAKRWLWQLPGSTLTRDDLAAELSAIEADYRAVWLARNRPGGLQHSAARLHKAHELFQDT